MSKVHDTRIEAFAEGLGTLNFQLLDVRVRNPRFGYREDKPETFIPILEEIRKMGQYKKHYDQIDALIADLKPKPKRKKAEPKVDEKADEGKADAEKPKRRTKKTEE